jgi:choice-of-anchor C domain-containing protein
MTRFLWSAILAVVSAVGLPLAAVASTGINNGSFEDGAFPDAAPFVALTSGTPEADAISGWTVTSGSVDWINTFWPAQDGTKSLDMNGTPTDLVPLPAGTVSQTLATAANNTYVVQFYLAGNPDCGAGDKTLFVSATGTAPQSYTFTNTDATTRTNMGWTIEAYTFVAKGSTTELTFAADAANTTVCGPALDSVSVTETAVRGADCKHDGWRTMSDDLGNPFRNQGDCVSFYATNGATPIGNGS